MVNVDREIENFERIQDARVEGYARGYQTGRLRVGYSRLGIGLALGFILGVITPSLSKCYNHRKNVERGTPYAHSALEEKAQK